MQSIHPIGLNDERTAISLGHQRLGITLPEGAEVCETSTGLLIKAKGRVAIQIPGLACLLSMNKAAWLESKWWNLREKNEEPIATPLAFDVGGLALGLGAEQGRGSVLTEWDAPSESLVFDFNGLGEPMLWLVAADTVMDALEGITIALMEDVHPITPLRGAQFGWMSWDELRADIKQDDIVEHADFIAENLGGEQAIILIDDGWQIGAGDWIPNQKFDKGMAWVAEEIHRRGMRAGLWMAPFMVALNSSLAKEHPDWLLRDEAGDYVTPNEFPQWGGKSGVLDVTRPEVIAWLRQLVDGVAGWGFDYLKFDFLANCLLGVAKDESIPRAVAYRDAVRAMRQVAGPQITVMGCGTPLIEGRGLFDAARVGDDVVTDWPLLRSRLSNIAVRHPLHRRFWWNDPDNVVVREPFAFHEGQFWATAVAMSEGAVFLGDDLRKLDAERLRLGQSIWPPAIARCKPLGMGKPVYGDEDTIGRGWVAETEMGRVVALLNWQEAPRTMEATWEEIGLEPGISCHAWEFWSRSPLGQVTGLSVEVPPHTSRVIALTPVDTTPKVIGCDRHVVVGAMGLTGIRWDESNATLSGRVEDTLPTLPTEFVVAVPRDRRIGAPEGATQVNVTESGDFTLLTLRMNGDGPWSVACPLA